SARPTGNRDPACAAPLIRDASVGSRGRSARHPGAARARLLIDDANVHRGRYRAADGSLPERASASVTNARVPLAKRGWLDKSCARRGTEGDMSHGVHAVQHEVEHHIEHEDQGGGRGKSAGERGNKKIALLIAVMALFLALAEMFGKSAQTEGI